MKQLLNTLYITIQGTYLAKDGETIDIRSEGKSILKIPLHNLVGIVCFGNVTCSPFLMAAICESNINLSFFSEHGRFLAKVYGKTRGNVRLRKRQYLLSESMDSSVELASSMILGKILNCRVNLQRSLRDHPDINRTQNVTLAIDNLAGLTRKARESKNLDELRGIEGLSASYYFGCLNSLIVTQKESFQFKERNRRPPLDPVNSLLSFFYTLLTNEIVGALESVGLDPAVGFLHRDRPGRPSLALDLMEELRPYMVDRFVLTLINRQQVSAGDFITSGSGAVTLTENSRKYLLAEWQKRKQENIRHPILEEQVPLGLLGYVQAMLLARVLRGELDIYPPFLVK